MPRERKNSLGVDSARRRLEARSWFAVVRAYQECTRRYGQMLAGLGLTVPQFDLLDAVEQLGGSATPKAIAERLVVTRGNVTGLLHRLRNRGLLAIRENAHDARSFFCELTPEGRDLHAQARDAASLFIREQLSPFDDSALQQTERSMNRMRSHLEAIEPDAILERARRPDSENRSK